MMAGIYAAMLIFFMNAYGGFKIGYLRKGNLIYSQALSLIFTNIFTYFQLSVLDKKLFEPKMVLVMTVADVLIVWCWTMLFQLLYANAFPPRRMLLISGERSDYHLIEKINARDDKYMICETINYHMGKEALIEKIHQYDAIIVGDIPSHERNVIIKYCFDHSIRTYSVPKISDILLRSSDELNLFDTPLLLSRNMGLSIEQQFVKRVIDIIGSMIGIIITIPFFIVIGLSIKLTDHGPIFYTQTRLTKDGRPFKIYKFRTMIQNAEKDGIPRLAAEGDPRILPVGRLLRATRLDELPQVLNILKGDMSIIGPRPQLVRDMVFMTEEQRQRHTVKPGLSGLAQVNGRNDIDWEDKLNWDLKYIKKITFVGDVKIIFQTVMKAFIKQEGITEGDMATAQDFGDYLLGKGEVSKEEYDEKQEEAKLLLAGKDIVKSKNELVSIIMPSYNTAEYIAESIESVLNQTYENWELIIVDDCSTDNTDEIVQQFDDERIKYHKNKKNSGAAVSRNRALKLARGKWIAFLDSDDLWLPEKLEMQINFMSSNNYHFSYTNYDEIDMDGRKTGIRVTGPKKITKTGMFNYCWPGCLTVMYDAEQIGLIQIADIKKNNDYAMWLKICKHADCYLLNKCLSRYRKGRVGSVSTHSIKTMIGWHYKLYRDAEQLGVLESIFNTGRNLIFGFYKKKRYVKTVR